MNRQVHPQHHRMTHLGWWLVPRVAFELKRHVPPTADREAS